MTDEKPDKQPDEQPDETVKLPGDAPRPGDDELEAELRRLFEDDRLSLAVRGDAADTVVAGARRRRRRQVMLAGVAAALAVLAMVSAGVVTVAMTRGHGVQTAQPNLSTSPDTEVTPSSPPVTPSASGPVPATSAPTDQPVPDTRRHPTTPVVPPAQPVGVLLTPDGYGQLTLGMSEQDAVAAHLVTAPASDVPPTSAGDGTTSAAPPPPKSACDVETADYPWISAAFDAILGLDQITAAEAHTPQGVGTGSTTAQILAAYPTARVSDTSIRVIGAASEYVFALRNGVVGSVTVQTGDTVRCTTN